MTARPLFRLFALPPLIFGVLFLLCPGAGAQTTITASGAVIDGDEEGGFGYYSFNKSSDSLFLVEGGGAGPVEYQWNGGTMTLEGGAKARTELLNGGWRQQAYARASLTNPHHFTEFDHEVQMVNGEPYIPHIFGASATSGIVTALQYGGTAAGYTSRPVFRARGEIVNANSLNNAYAFIGFQLYNASLPSSYVFESTFDTFIVGEAAPAGDNQTIEMRVIASIQFRTSDLAEGETHEGTWHGEADFFHTLELVGMDVRDTEGNLVTDAEIFNADGSLIAVVDATAVPEPSAALLTLGAAGMLLQRGRRTVTA